MEVRNATKKDLENTLAEVNRRFDNNVIWKREPEYMGQTRKGEAKYRLTLRVRDSHGKGARLSFSGRHLTAACWHVHGEFFDALPEDAEIVVSGPRGRQVKRPGDSWEDYNIGSVYRPMYYSEACECGL